MSIYGPDPIFGDHPLRGWEVGPSDAEKVYFAFSRTDAEPVDWQGERDIPSRRIPGSNRTLYQDMGAQPLRLATRIILPNEAAYRKFWGLCDRTGLLRMNADYSVWPGRAPNPVRIAGQDYVEFPDVVVAVWPSKMTFDARGAVHCDVTFEREDGIWS